MLAKDFNFEQFGYFLEEKQKLLTRILALLMVGLMVLPMIATVVGR